MGMKIIPTPNPVAALHISLWRWVFASATCWTVRRSCCVRSAFAPNRVNPPRPKWHADFLRLVLNDLQISRLAVHSFDRRNWPRRHAPGAASDWPRRAKVRLRRRRTSAGKCKKFLRSPGGTVSNPAFPEPKKDVAPLRAPGPAPAPKTALKSALRVVSRISGSRRYNIGAASLPSHSRLGGFNGRLA